MLDKASQKTEYSLTKKLKISNILIYNFCFQILKKFLKRAFQ